MSVDRDNLGLRLLRAESAAEVQRIVDGDPTMSWPGNWCPLDDRDTNFNQVSNQSSTGAKAVTELVTNMVDAMLTKHCLEHDIDPKGKDAPRSMYEAVDRWFQMLNGGRIINADESSKRNYARENLIIGVTGKSMHAKPCYTFADNGEGQHPKNFRSTFLSLSAKNKSQIPFVQGKYNMGSSGILTYCKNWFKLIISRRYDKEGAWGWTLIRKNTPADGLPFAEYFIPDNGIMTIIDSAIQPFRNKGGEFADVELQSGTIIKLYDVYLGKTHTGYGKTRTVFNENLVETILPFRIYDFRLDPDPAKGGIRTRGIDERPFYGLEYQIRRPQEADVKDETGASEIIDSFLVAPVVDPELGEILITAIPLPRVIPSWYKTPRNRIFHHVNGQVQFKEMRGVLSQCRLPALMDRIAILVDASHLTDNAHSEIWKGDREHIRETELGQLYKDIVRDMIRTSPDLKKLNDRLAREKLDSVSTESSHKLIETLVERDRNLARLLAHEVPGMPVYSGPRPDLPPSRTDLKYNPTYLRVVKGGSEPIFKVDLPINKQRPVQCQTNVMDDYFYRPDSRGIVCFEEDETANQFRCSVIKLKNGAMTISFKPNPKVLSPGEEIEFRFGIFNDAMPGPVYADKAIRIRLTESEKRSKPSPSPKPKSPPSQQVMGLPNYLLLTRDGREIDGDATAKWDDHDGGGNKFDELSGGYVENLGEGKARYLINYDNTYFQNALHAEKTESRRSEVSKKYVLGMRILMLGLERAIETMERESHENGENAEIPDTLRWVATKGVASVVLSVCDQLPNSFQLVDDDDDEG